VEILRGYLGKLAVCAVGVLLVACSPPPAPEGQFPAQTVEKDVHEAQNDEGVQDSPSALPLVAEGTWLLWTEIATCVATMGVEVESLSESLALVTLDDLGGGLVKHRLRNCLIRQTPVLGIVTEIPDAVAESIPEREYFGILGGYEAGSVYLTQESVETWGLRLEDPFHDQMPSSADDPRVWDMDGDGKPGVTLPVGPGLCEVYVIQRGFSRWSGRVESPTRVAGGGSAWGEERVLGATSGFCLAQNEVRYMDDLHRFALVRVDGSNGSMNLDFDGDGRVTCDEVRAYGLEPFAPRKPDDTHCKMQELTPR